MSGHAADPPAGRGEPDGDRAGAPATCAAKGCRAVAGWALVWNNPRLHDPERAKVWLACPEHRDGLADFLRSRGFLRAVVPADQAPHDPGPAGRPR